MTIVKSLIIVAAALTLAACEQPKHKAMANGAAHEGAAMMEDGADMMKDNADMMSN